MQTACHASRIGATFTNYNQVRLGAIILLVLVGPTRSILVAIEESLPA